MSDGNQCPPPPTGGQGLDRHATYIVATFLAGSSRGNTARSWQPTQNGALTQLPLRNAKSAGRRSAQRLDGDRQIAGIEDQDQALTVHQLEWRGGQRTGGCPSLV
ncbi:MAG TPA: hypothetical protein VGR26_10825 [Acidimicrobiales bacterium]|nr:hypothetical protein [Acidimicrobiales bacterium]